MTKKLVAVLLTLALTAALMIPAFADNAVSYRLEEFFSAEDFSEEVTVAPETTTAAPTTTAPATTAPAATTTAAAADDGGFSLDIDINDILASDAFQEIMSNKDVIDITNIVIELLAKYNADSLKQMGQEEAQKFIQSIVDTVAGVINQMFGTLDLAIVYDPLKVMGNLFDFDADALTTTNPADSNHPDELELPFGDADGDGRITAADARAVLRRAARIIKFTPAQDARADVDRDGKITANDARILLRVSAGLQTL